MGLDGVILMAFLLGFPANEIVMPIIFMAYLSQGTLTEMSSLASMKLLLISHGWTFRTAVSMILFSYPLAVLHYAADHPQGNQKPALDSAGRPASHRSRRGALHALYRDLSYLLSGSLITFYQITFLPATAPEKSPIAGKWGIKPAALQNSEALINQRLCQAV